MQQRTGNRLDHAYTVASEASKKSQLRQKEGYDTKVRGATIQKGDRDLVKIVAFGEGKHKLADKWEHDPYTVLVQPNADIPVFTVQKENGEGRNRNLHMNHLLPIGYLTDTEPPVQREKPVPKPRLKKQTTPATSTRPESQGVHSDESSDEEPLELVIVEHDASSDTTITEEQHDDSTVTDTTEDSDSDGDAHSQEATDTEAEGTETDEESQQEDSPDEASTASSPEPVRRSTRERQQPAWMRSGKFDLSKSVGTPVSDSEWYKKVQFIT
ncbi:uncharacterized protein LOC134684155 [Mytilus trossulus]|uniref:uncharacterized protein LOC134684155 n=1 Tax=Mytilus trossulus TaxID=6551 RepID=UPI0030073D5D